MNKIKEWFAGSPPAPWADEEAHVHTEIPSEGEHTVVYDRYITTAKRVDSGDQANITPQFEKELHNAIRGGSLFKFCSDESVDKVAKQMKRVVFKKGDVLMEQGEPQTRVYLIAKGSVSRLRFVNDRLHQVETVASAPNHRGMFGALHVLKEEPTYATALAEEDGVAYTLDSADLHRMLETDPDLSKEIIYSLSKEIFRMSKLRTPLLEQDGKPNNIFVTSLGATIESYYRSGLNSWLNAKLTGGKPASFFPNFHIQIPSRVFYINGFKIIRQYLGEHVNANEYSHPSLMRLGMTIVPGVCMTPVSSLLEACNADHMNNEPLIRRVFRGYIPRTLREVIFGMGINQLSDACEERVAEIESPFLRTCVGSMMAGSMAGYLSHVPHTLSTLKMLQPHRTYGDILNGMINDKMPRTPKEWMPAPRRLLAGFMTFFLPTGCLIRTAQICGSFIIINGTINALTRNTEPLDVGDTRDAVLQEGSHHAGVHPYHRRRHTQTLQAASVTTTKPEGP